MDISIDKLGFKLLSEVVQSVDSNLNVTPTDEWEKRWLDGGRGEIYTFKFVKSYVKGLEYRLECIADWSGVNVTFYHTVTVCWLSKQQLENFTGCEV